MKGYIEHNHKLACDNNNKNDKLMYNSICGRTLFNKERSNSNVRKISYVDRAPKAASRDTFRDY